MTTHTTFFMQFGVNVLFNAHTMPADFWWRWVIGIPYASWHFIGATMKSYIISVTIWAIIHFFSFSKNNHSIKITIKAVKMSFSFLIVLAI
jgi:hypothetical protein